MQPAVWPLLQACMTPGSQLKTAHWLIHILCSVNITCSSVWLDEELHAKLADAGTPLLVPISASPGEGTFATSCMLMHSFAMIPEAKVQMDGSLDTSHSMLGLFCYLTSSITTVMQVDRPMLAHGTSWTLCTQALGSCVTSTNLAYVIPLFSLHLTSQLVCYMLG